MFFSSDEESSQVFIPFVSDVRVSSDLGSGSSGHHSIDIEDMSNSEALAGTGTSPGTGNVGLGSEKSRQQLTPPSSPHVSKER